MELQNPILPFLLIFLVANISAISCCHDNERLSLLSFKSHVTDPSNRLSSWQGQNCCTWHGIRCSTELHIISVDLRNPNPPTLKINMNSELVSMSNSTFSALTGTISSSLFALSHIRYLDLSFNNFKFSRIPPGIENLTQLTYLNLSNAMFSDSITTQISNLTSLEWLDLSCSLGVTDFSSISYNLSSQLNVQAGAEYTYINNGCYLSSWSLDWLRGLHKLKGLFLTGFDLSEAAKTTQWANPLSGLLNLRFLVLSNCKITGKIPIFQFLNLTQLSFLVMDFNSLTSEIPVQLTNLTSLLALDLTSSNLQGPIPYLPQLVGLHLGKTNLTVDLKSMFSVPWPKLEILDIRSTQVIGSIPPSIGNTTSLVSFVAYNCFIGGKIPSSMTNLSHIERLLLDFNRLVGELPPSISNLKSLKVLSLMQNSLQGNIPDSICNIPSLQYLALASNNLSGSLPDCITHFPNLQVLFLSLNSFTGTIQSMNFSKTSNPYIVGLGFNKLTVKLDQLLFPPNFQPQMLDLSSCNISGGIPDFFSNWAKLSFLSLAYNNFSGLIPSWLFNLPKLSYLDLSFNRLKGFLPPKILMNSFFGPTTLNLAGNFLEGQIPSFLENIDTIDLSGNNFTGYVPPQLGLGNAVYISLSDNELSGQIPLSFCQENNVLMFLDLSSNNLSGSIPNSLGNCKFLTFLNIAQNNFSNSVPTTLANVENLSYLDLTGNRFEGLFPSFEKLQNLEVLKMGYNKFAGKIPQFIGELKKLRILVLKSNSFNESIPQEINKLDRLQIMDLSNNKLSGFIPEKLNGLRTLVSRPTDGNLLGYVISGEYAGVELNMAYKGLVYQFDVVRTYLSGIDLSLNSLTGNIPQEMTLLKGLAMLNLSHNALSGEIPRGIGDMIGLQSLDLSFNNLNGFSFYKSFGFSWYYEFVI
ncbi:hypothetical protein JCGZ_20984 [Jatropha curcas]|uniref:Leucine-rich repeat-containing N-terminal plant-type domain-containing protein n=1 Tax=Jatropha curcas TaxID=180498 RepID=A0A067K5F8_JATCU|nr:hypothetical protein JCGZ_20984 [Jatropha curcas]